MDDGEEQIEVTLTKAAKTEGPWEYGQYIERRDGDEWVPLIYGGMTLETAEQLHIRNVRNPLPNHFRNSRVVRRAVSPWEVQS